MRVEEIAKIFRANNVVPGSKGGRSERAGPGEGLWAELQPRESLLSGSVYGTKVSGGDGIRLERVTAWSETSPCNAMIIHSKSHSVFLLFIACCCGSQ